MRRSALARAFVAEFLKIHAFKFPLYASVGLVVYVILVTYNLVAAEALTNHVRATSAISVLPYLVWASWAKIFLIPVFLIVFAAYCTVVDSQYGMVRIGCSQPLSRLQYATAKTAAIIAHSGLCILFYVALLVVSSAATGGRWWMNSQEARQLAAFCVRLLVLSIGIVWLAAATALLRRSLLAGFVTSLLAVIGFLWLNVLPPHYGMRPYLLFRYFLYPIAAMLPPSMQNIQIPNAGCASWQFLLAALGTPALCWAAAVTHFSRRDITE